MLNGKTCWYSLELYRLFGAQCAQAVNADLLNSIGKQFWIIIAKNEQPASTWLDIFRQFNIC